MKFEFTPSGGIATKVAGIPGCHVLSSFINGDNMRRDFYFFETRVFVSQFSYDELREGEISIRPNYSLLHVSFDIYHNLKY